MARRKLIAGNWKMHNTVSESLALVNQLKAKLAGVKDVDVVVCPPFTALSAVAAFARGTGIGVGAQNVHWAAFGAFTGEVSVAMLKEIPVEYALVGHSERRQYFGETDETVNQRLEAALAGGLKPIVCIGETLAQRQANQTQAVVATQVEKGLSGLTPEQMAGTILAYEPVWAIGTGLTATPAQAQDVHALVRAMLRQQFGTVADSVRVLYGGSVKAANAKELMGQADIDGALVGVASLKAGEFVGIVNGAR